MKGQKNPLDTKDTNNLCDVIKIKDIVDGILITETTYIAFLEVFPLNFKLRSEREQKYIIDSYEELLKIMKAPFYVFTIAKKADLKEHFEYIEEHRRTEKNEAVCKMIEEYQEFVRQTASENAVKRRFIVAIPYQKIVGVSRTPFSQIKAELMENAIRFRDAIAACENEVYISQDSQFTAQIMYELLNLNASEHERIPVL